MMMQEVQVQASLIANSGGGGSAVKPNESGGSGSGSGGAESIAGGFSEDDKTRIEEGDRNSGRGGGNRWPTEETLALLKIRSDMDAVFRDSTFKGPLWEEVSRKMADLGYHRSAKKSKEKFENVYKYHKRTRDGRACKSDGKAYRFFDQLETLDHQNHPSPLPPPPLPVTSTAAMPMQQTLNPPVVYQLAVPSMANTVAPTLNPPLIPLSQPPTTNLHQDTSHQNMLWSFIYNSTSSSTSSDEEPKSRIKRKRKWKIFFKRLMKDVMEKQEEMQKKFLETMERKERDRMNREEAWRVQEMVRMNLEHELLVQERSMASAKDAALTAFLKKVTEQQPNLQIPNAAAPLPQMQLQLPENPLPAQMSPPPQQQQTPPPSAPPTVQQQTKPPPVPILQQTTAAPKSVETPKAMDNGGGGSEDLTPPSSSRWPKAEVQALITLRTNVDLKYQESSPKGPWWEEMSAGMQKLGYNRNAKRCKEKWENINKYFKKVKESNKKRPEDSKTCPYFYQLDALYKEKAKNDASSFNSVSAENPMVPIMAQPEQQWPLSQEQQHHSAEPPSGIDVENHHDDEDVEDNEEEDDDDEVDGYEIVTNKIASAAANMN